MKYLEKSENPNILNYKNFLREFTETPKNTPTIYQDDNLSVKIVRTFDSCKELGKNTGWCSNNKSQFYYHNSSAIMYRFLFKDGYKLRLTWDYIDHSAYNFNYSGGTHWGSGGVVDGERIGYYYIRPKDESNPFMIDYNKNDYRQELKSEVITREIETGTFTKSKNYFIYYKKRFYEMDNRLIKYVQFLIDIAVLYPTGGNEYYGERTYQLDDDMWKKSLTDRVKITSQWLSNQEAILFDNILSGLKSQYRDININSLNI